MAKLGAVIFHCLCGLCLLVGIFDVLWNYEENHCEMSYMYETPQYKRVPLPENVLSKYPRYGLYLYGEGHYFRVISNLKLSGIPVLYIPGNGGSMKQSRSVASFLLRKSEQINWEPHFNVFTVDLNEELVAFYGATLTAQVDFIHHCITTILELYKESGIANPKPKSVILVGHSMGGMIARGAFASKGFDPHSVNTIYTLATPHVHPVLSTDTHIATFYETVNKFWEENCESLKHVTMVSVSGGDRDFQVHGASARLPECSNTSLSTVSTAIPRAWVAAEHQTAVWCKQVVLATTRSMFDMADPKTHQISENSSVRWRSVRYHFDHNPGLSKFSLTIDPHVKLVTSHDRINVEAALWSYITEDRKSKESAYYMFDVAKMSESKKEIAVAKTTAKKDRWILACAEANSDSAIDLSKRGYLTPKFKVVHLDLEELLHKNYKYLLVSVSKLSQGDHFAVNFLHHDEYAINITVPHMFSNLWTFNRGYRLNHTIGNTHLQFYHSVTLSGMHSIYHAYKISLESQGKVGGDPLLQLQLPERSGFTYGLQGNLSVKRLEISGASVPVVHVYTDGEKYDARIRVQFVELLGQIMRFHGAALPAMTVINIFLAYSYQMKILMSGKGCILTADALTVSAVPYKIQPFNSLVKKLYTYETFFISWHAAGLPVPDVVLIDDIYHTWFAFMPLVLFLYANEVVRVAIFLQAMLVQLFSNLLRCSSWDQNPNAGPSLVMSTLHTIVLALLASASGGLSLVYITVVNFVDLVMISGKLPADKKGEKMVASNEIGTKDNKESSPEEDSDQAEMVKKMELDLNDESCAASKDPSDVTFRLKFSLHLLWSCLAALGLPSLVALVKGYSTSVADPMLVPAIFASLLFILHRQQHGDVQPSLSRGLVCRLLYPLAVFTSLVCLHSLHRLPFFILIFLSFHIAMQYFE